MGLPPDPILGALWKRVLDHWEDEATHTAFLDYCQKIDCLVEAAVRYRGMTGDRERSKHAEKKLKAVALLAMAKLEVSRTHSEQRASHAGSYALIAVFLAASLGLLAYLSASR